jgi:hypothetical protein
MTRQLHPFRFLHIGDLHVTDSKLQNHSDLVRIVDEINTNCAGAIDYVILPGDIADNAKSDQYCLVRQQMDRLKVQWRAIPGDHDFEQRSLDNFYDVLGCRWLPFVEEINGCVCLFLDSVSSGTGGPDFKLGRQQIDWLKTELDRAKGKQKTAAIFMHTYPADFGDEAAEITTLIDWSSAVLVDMGHTHYNELANDGRTIYASTRSTGQIEEGDVGYSFAAVDGGAVSWRFKPLGSPWPFVMITSPPDRRLTMLDHHQAAFGEIRASVWGASDIDTAEARIDDGEWTRMTSEAGGIVKLRTALPGGAYRLAVRVKTQDGQVGHDEVEVDPRAVQRCSTGSDAGRIDAWQSRHLMATQLGPNRNGRKW